MPKIETTTMGVKVADGFNFNWQGDRKAAAELLIEKRGDGSVEIIITPSLPRSEMSEDGDIVQKGPFKSASERYQCYMDAMCERFAGPQHDVRQAVVHTNYYGVTINNTSVLDVAKALEDVGLAPKGTTQAAQNYMQEAEGRASIRAAAAEATAAQKPDILPRG